MVRFRSTIVVTLLALSSTGHIRAADEGKPNKPAAKTPKFELRDGDRVVFLGNAIIERAQQYGYWETMLTARYPHRNVTFRNLGWSGDTVWAESRGIFDPPAVGYKRMIEHVARLKPMVIFLGYGGNEAFAGKKALPVFIKQYNKLIDDLTKVSAEGVRCVLISPNRHDESWSLKLKVEQIDQLNKRFRLEPIPRRSDHQRARAKINSNLKLYGNAIRQVAIERAAFFVELTTTLVGSRDRDRYHGPLTDDGMHLNAAGYRQGAEVIEKQLFLSGRSPHSEISLKVNGELVEAKRVTVSELQASGEILRFRARTNFVPHVSWHGRALTTSWLRIVGLPNGRHTFTVDATAIATATAKEWSKGLWVDSGPDFDQGKRLRQAIIDKNRLYFYRWRPQNITYLFLFRKHEQGQNAKELDEFDKLIAAKEQEIAKLRQPVVHTYEIIRFKKKNIDK